MVYSNTGINYEESLELNQAVVHWNFDSEPPQNRYVVVSFGSPYTEEGWYFDTEGSRKNIEWEGPGIYYFDHFYAMYILAVPKEEIISWTYPVEIIPQNCKGGT